MTATTYPHLLPPNATKLERAIAGPTGRIDNAFDATIIDTLLNADTCPADYLPWLAWHLSLDLWDWQWSESKRRSVIRKAIELARAKGTPKGIRMAAEIVDTKVTQFLVPPQGFFASEELSKTDWDAWLHQMPELRIKLAEGHGTAYVDEFFADDDPLPGVTYDTFTWRVFTIGSGDIMVVEAEFSTEDEANDYALTLSGLEEFVFVSYGPTLDPQRPPPWDAGGSAWGIAAPDYETTPTETTGWVWNVYRQVGAVWTVLASFATQAAADTYAATLSNIEVLVARARPTVEASELDPLPGGSFIGEDDGWVLHGRRVVLRQNGVETPLQEIVRTTWTEEGTTFQIERVSTLGTATMAFVADLDDEGYATDKDEKDPEIISLRLDHAYNHEKSELGLTMVKPSLEPQDPRYERESDIGTMGPDFFADVSCASYDEAITSPTAPDYYAFAGIDEGGDMLADRIWLLDPNVTTPMSLSISFADVDRVGWPAYHADVMIDLQTKEVAPAWFADVGTIDDSFVVEEDGEPIDRACKAVVVSKSFRDKIGCAFNPWRFAEPQDILTETMTVDQKIPNSL